MPGLLLLPCVAMAASPDPGTAPTPDRHPADVAVVIGNAWYDEASGLPHVENNAEAVTAWLHDVRGVDASAITTLHDASRLDMEAAIARAGRDVQPGGTVWVYFSGHGVAGGGGEPLWLGVDVHPDDCAFATWDETVAISVARATQLAGAHHAEVVLLSDTSHRPDSKFGHPLPLCTPPAPADVVARRHVVHWSAALPGEMPGTRYSAATWAWLRALSGEGDGAVDGRRDGVITWEEAELASLRLLDGARVRGPRPELTIDRRAHRDAVVTGLPLAPAPTSAAPPGAATPAIALGAPGGPWSGEHGVWVSDVPVGEISRFGETTRVPSLRWMVTEVTQGMWEDVGFLNLSDEAIFGVPTRGRDLPVIEVSWCDALAFANVLSEKDGFRPLPYAGVEDCVASPDAAREVPSSPGWRLPTETEWQWAASGGNADTWAGTNEQRALWRYANVADVQFWSVTQLYTGIDEDDGYAGLMPVGRKEPNGFGLRDMSGNVGEWTSTPFDAGRAVVRGGAWNDRADYSTVLYSVPYPVYHRDKSIGFRLVRSAP